MALTLTTITSMMGLAVDLGRMLIVKNELQTFVDSSALAAASQLNGMTIGLTQANTTATNGPLGTTVPNGHTFDTQRITNVTIGYATTLNGPTVNYATATSGSTSVTQSNNYRFVTVTANAPVNLYFLGLVPGISSTNTVAASATAGSAVLPSGMNYPIVVPLSPAAHTATDMKNFGLTPGLSYTMKWGNGNTTTCAGDSGFSPANEPSQHGFVDLGEGNSNSEVRDSIVNGGYPTSPLTLPARVDNVPGNRGSGIFAAFATRSSQDTDVTSTDYATYVQNNTGNGRRVITAPIHDPALSQGNGNGSDVIIGFGSFLLDTPSNISGSSGAICATYIGPASLNGGGGTGADGTQVYHIVLYK
jgi:Flp pilus assembly protein TadG